MHTLEVYISLSICAYFLEFFKIFKILLLNFKVKGPGELGLQTHFWGDHWDTCHYVSSGPSTQRKTRGSRYSAWRRIWCIWALLPSLIEF
jgi:hypothetical protein